MRSEDLLDQGRARARQSHDEDRRPARVAAAGALLDAKAVHGGRSAYNHLLCLAQTNNLPKRRVGEVLELVGLTDVARKRTKGFSLGMSQRLGIAATLLGDPHVLMFDEPVNGLDPEGILWIRNLLKSLAAQGRTVFVSSHLLSEMALMADHLVVIGRGMGGFPAAMESLLASPATAPLLTRERFSTLAFFSYTFIPLSTIAFPHITIFCLTARRMSQFKRTVVFYPLCILAIWLPCVFLGVAANAMRDAPRIASKL